MNPLGYSGNIRTRTVGHLGRAGPDVVKITILKRQLNGLLRIGIFVLNYWETKKLFYPSIFLKVVRIVMTKK